MFKYDNERLPKNSFLLGQQWDNALIQNGFFSFTQESTGQGILDENNIPYFLNIKNKIKENLLHFFWIFSSNYCHYQLIEKLVRTFISRFKQLIQHFCQKGALLLILSLTSLIY